MKNKKYIIIAVLAVIVIAAVIMIAQPFKWSEKSFEAVVQETVTQSDGEIRLIVERTTEIYGDQQGDTVSVTLKDSFTEETPFYYPVVYEIKLTNP